MADPTDRSQQEHSRSPDRPRITASMITALAAGVVSLSALTVSIYEAYLMREQQAASVLPIIDFWASYAYKSSYSLHLANKGLGPAFIEHIDVRVDESSQIHWNAVLETLAGGPVPHDESAIIGSVLAPGETGALVTIDDSVNGEKIWKSAGRVTLQVCYCSVFGDCWTTTVSDLNVGTPTTSEADVCPSGDDVIF